MRPVLGVESILNNWGVGSASRIIDSDWVITLPGQYLMVDLREYIADLRSDAAADDCKVDVCDFRDLPVQLSVSYYDREEDVVTIVPDEDSLVLSPASATPPPVEVLLLRNEVNVMRWYGAEGADEGALNSQYGADFPISGSAENGWARLSVNANVTDTSVSNPSTPSVCEVSDTSPETCTPVANAAVPMVGFAAWKRTLDNADRNFGRIVDHSFTVSSAAP